MEERILNIAVLGAGALGCAIGGTLAEAGHEVLLINRNAAHVQAINTHGLVMRGPQGERTVRARAAINAEGQRPVDLVIVLVKSFHTASAMQAAIALVGPDTVVLSLQNGLGHEDILADIVGRSHVLAGKAYVGGVVLAPGRIYACHVKDHILFGNMLGVGQGDLIAAAAIAIPVTLILALKWRDLMLHAFDPAQAQVSGLPVKL